MKSLGPMLCAGLFALFLTGQAHAQVTLIIQPTTFPITISHRGSYRLNSNLRVPDPNTTAINITAAGPVTIDLNGFSITGPVTCAGVPAKCSASGSGNGIKSGTNSIVSVFNGAIVGMGNDGISLGGVARVRDVIATSNAISGISIATGVVSECVGDSNGGDGIDLTFNATVTASSAIRNGGDGIDATSGGAVSASAAGSNKGIGIFGDTVIGSTATSNKGNGFLGGVVIASSARFNGAYGVSGADFAFDVFLGNTSGPTNLGIQLGTSDCNGSACP